MLDVITKERKSLAGNNPLSLKTFIKGEQFVTLLIKSSSSSKEFSNNTKSNNDHVNGNLLSSVATPGKIFLKAPYGKSPKNCRWQNNEWSVNDNNFSPRMDFPAPLYPKTKYLFPFIRESIWPQLSQKPFLIKSG